MRKADLSFTKINVSEWQGNKARCISRYITPNGFIYIYCPKAETFKNPKRKKKKKIKQRFAPQSAVTVKSQKGSSTPTSRRASEPPCY